MMKRVCFIVLIVLGGCAFTDLTMTMSPVPEPQPDIAINKPVLHKIDIVAVLPFVHSDKSQYTPLPPPFSEGDVAERYPYENDGDVIADRVAVYLMKSFLFKVVDRKNVEAILEEQAFQLSGAVDQRTALEAGKIVGADAILTGNVNGCRYGKQWRYQGNETLYYEFGVINVDFKLIHVGSGELAAIVHHELASQNFMEEPVEISRLKVINNPTYYNKFIPGLDQLINLYIERTVQPIIEAKRSAEAE